MRKPNFFIVGAPRCATSAMNTYLKQHPEIFMAKKESHFFATDLNAPHFTKDKDKYLALFSKAGDEKRIGEASVMYLYSRQAASKIKEFCPRARIIIMLRNPVDMMYTLHRHNVYHGSENLIDFEVALNAEKERKKGLRIPKNVRLVEGLFYRELAKYTQQVKRYLDVFGQENVFVVIYDEFKNFSKLVNDWRDRRLDSFSSFLGIAMYETFPDWKRMKKLGVDYLKLWQEGFSEIGSRQIDREDYFNRMVRIEL